MRPNGTAQQLENRRREAVALLKQGWTPSALAQKMGCARGSIYRWLTDIRAKGTRGLKARPASGRPPKLNARQKQMLTKILLNGALSYGYSTDLWTQKRIGEVIVRKFGIRYHFRHLWRFLIGLGWSCQKPETRDRERDEKAISRWKRYHLARIKKSQETQSPLGLPRREWVFVGPQRP